jgi:hypothetical protein
MLIPIRPHSQPDHSFGILTLAIILRFLFRRRHGNEQIMCINIAFELEVVWQTASEPNARPPVSHAQP